MEENQKHEDRPHRYQSYQGAEYEANVLSQRG